VAPLLFVVSTEAKLERVVLVTRHGERERLWKHPSTLSESVEGESKEGGPSLTDVGVTHLQEVGRQLRERYFHPACQATCLEGRIGSAVYLPDEVWVESSGLDRSLGSAFALHHSMWASSNGTSGLPVPIHSRREADDQVLRAYTKCPELGPRLLRWSQGDEFRSREASSLSLRKRVGKYIADPRAAYSMPAGGLVPLLDWWNAYDAMRSLRAIDGYLPASITSHDFTEAAQLAAWLEAKKFGTEIAGNLCGGPLLKEIARRISAQAATPRLIHYSAHYPTMLCLLSTLGIAADSGHAADAWLGSFIFPPGSVMAFEVHSVHSGKQFVHLRYWNGQTDQEWTNLRLPCAASVCSMEDFQVVASQRSFPDTAAWCAACGNTVMPVCQNRQPASCPVSTTSSDSGWGVALGVGTVLLVGASIGCYVRRRSEGCANLRGHTQFDDEKGSSEVAGPTTLGTREEQATKF